ncbi:PREDICTED: iron-sulfur cluster co-chaperone protein HscB, mitochondrial [Ceratosolen solmsi marchali]|uniref:Iron-sulfur cluster co-chaperone protein HscB, mitochondrial n=1 Tax=Ceratosolen solmsi marchali TaxID=326594 RepID=A0AAJ6VJE7_9HYME|nr:PREDICTED: iron-sulfur cluster co-chaperone protein HscB, mitochondrial [Ceratosolen solmsi marchali]
MHARLFLKHKNILIFQKGNILHFSDCFSKCWKCNYPHKSNFFCSKCNALQKLPKDLNYFDIIGVSKDFDVPVTDIQKKYRQLQSLLHPDKFGQKSEVEKEISRNVSSLVNKAYTTLLHPLDRGLYMLKLYNICIPEEKTSLDHEFLMKIMEKNEEIEKYSENVEKILEFTKENRITLVRLTKQISQAFHNKDIDQATKLLIKMKYYVNVDNKLKNFRQILGVIE